MKTYQRTSSLLLQIVLLLDGDFVASVGLHERLSDSAETQSKDTSQHRHAIMLTLPAFEASPDLSHEEAMLPQFFRSTRYVCNLERDVLTHLYVYYARTKLRLEDYSERMKLSNYAEYEWNTSV
jgi:hypothetical protein